MSQQTKRFYDFSGYRLDPLARLLLRGDEPVSIPPKAFDVLLILIQNCTRMVEKEELMKAVWPDSFVEEGNLSQNVFILRKALSDGQDGRRYIVTVPGRGYRFDEDVVEVQEENPPTQSPPIAAVTAIPPVRRKRWYWISAGIAALLAMGLSWFFLHQSRTQVLLSETQITTNSSEASLSASVISPDGKSIAYADDHGLYLRYIASGETHSLPAPADARIYNLSWFPDGSKLLVSGVSGQDIVSRAWLVQPLQNSVRKLRDDATGAVVSPDGEKILFTSAYDSEIWVMNADGGDPRPVLVGTPEDAFSSLSWFPDGQRISYLRSPAIPAGSIESCELDCRTPAILVSSRLLRFATLSPGGRLLYGIADWETGIGSTTFWELAVDLKNGRASGATHRLFRWPNILASQISFSADGKRAITLKGFPETDVYVGSLLENGTALRDAHRVTLDDRNDLVWSWTPDSQAVLFSSNRNGNLDIFRQRIDEPRAIPIVENKYAKAQPILSPDGVWLLYFAPPIWDPLYWNNTARLMRSPVAGGPAETVLEERGLYFFDCTQSPVRHCVYGIIRAHEIDFYNLDWQHGRGALLAKMDATPDTIEYSFALSPDGSHLAAISLLSRSGQVHVISLADGSYRDIPIKGWTNLHYIKWAANAKGWYVSSETATMTTILFIDLAGNAYPLARQTGLFFQSWGVPSPNGQHLAFVQYNLGNNAWLLENF